MEQSGHRPADGVVAALRRCAWLGLLLFLTSVWAVPLSAQQAGPEGQVGVSPFPVVIELSLREAILSALEHSLDITVERFAPLIRQAEVLQALGEFDTTAFLNTTIRREKSPPTVVFVGVFAHGNLKVHRRSLQLAEDLLQSNRERVKAGILAPSEILRAESSVAAQQAAILDAEAAVKDAGDALRRLINTPQVDLADDVNVLPTDEPRSDYQPLDLKWVIYQALTHRPDLIARKTELENLGIQLLVARNQLLPTLDLTIFYRTKGAGRSLDTSFDRYSSLIFDDYGGTIEFSVPLEQRSARGSVTSARLQRQQALFELKNSEDAIVVEVRRQLRRVETKYEQIGRFRRARQLALDRLDDENDKLLLGTATTLDVLEAQRELTSAERDELRATVDFNIALVELRRAMGALLQDYQVQFAEP